jgi:hypothetical protein
MMGCRRWFGHHPNRGGKREPPIVRFEGPIPIPTTDDLVHILREHGVDPGDVNVGTPILNHPAPGGALAAAMYFARGGEEGRCRERWSAGDHGG